MHGLVDERPTSIHCQSSAPLRLTVVFRRPIPLHTSLCQQRPADYTLLNPVLEPSNVRFVPVLKHDTEFHASSVGCLDEFVSSTGGNVNGLLREHMQTVTRSHYPVCCMQARRTSYRHEIHWAMTQERVEVLIG